ncbi:MAG: glucose-6-phosphate isomerase [Betaproteobacteria bacterium]
MTDAAFVRCDRAPAWAELQAYFEGPGRSFDLRVAFAGQARRFERWSQPAPHVFGDLSKNLIDTSTEALLLALAEQCGLAAQRDAMFAGQPINRSEQRQVMHFLLRQREQRGGQAWACELQAVHATGDAMLAYAEQVRADADITDVVNIGIGGSDLGPCMAVQALEEFRLPGKRFHFISNVDGHALSSLLDQLQPRSTLFLIASKTFTTAETMANAHSAKRWFEAQLGAQAQALLPRHFAALTTNVSAAAEFGISTCFGFWDWVGGRYSLMSAIGLPLAIAIGSEHWRQLLAGAHAMDEHFRTAPLAQNLPVRLGLLDVWYRNFHGFASRCVAPYHSRLARWPAYLQQLEMESNGKRVDRLGQALGYETSPVVWGEPGTNGQHAFFQMLHQGTSVVPVEFVLVRRPAHGLTGQHSQLLANGLAQAQALMLGRAGIGDRDFPGNRPSTVLLLDRLDPASLGALIALQEHRVFTSGAIWGINSFDQWGVELGKVLAADLEPRLRSGDVDGLDASTAGLISRLRA